jgi:EAL domain-containing protein (putative c-di-GMP-specific phosphodiesterase class I)
LDSGDSQKDAVNALRIHLAAGDVLFGEGDAPTTAFLIEAGEIEISITIHGWRVVLSQVRAGELLGEMAVFEEGPRSATAVALTDCVLFPIDREQIGERLSKTDPIIRALLEGQAKRYRGAIEAILGVQRVTSNASGTLAEPSGVDKLRLETHLREALASDGLDVRYQPILHIPSDRIAGYEALIRWNHPDRGTISPMELVGLAEETALIVEVGEYVFDTACKAVQRLILGGADPKPFIAVNVSARQLEHPGLIERIVARVESAGVPRGSLKLEITESQALDQGLVAAVIDLCHRHGIAVALDDFGTGYSHLTHMHKLAFDTLKLDQAFSRSMLSDPRSMVLVESIVRMGKALNADIVAEGVETEEILDALRLLGCDYAQGYFIGRPQTLDELIGSASGAG